MNSKDTKAIIRDLSKKYNLPEDEIFKICRSPFELLKDVIHDADRETLTFPSLRIPNFGVFYCSEGRREFYRNLNSKGDDKQE
jgi:hypothetical protein